MARQIDMAESTYREWEYGRRLKPPLLLKTSQVLTISVTALVIGDRFNPQEHLDQLKLLETSLAEIRLNLGSRIQNGNRLF
jgi:hypothetical protein